MSKSVKKSAVKSSPRAKALTTSDRLRSRQEREAARVEEEKAEARRAYSRARYARIRDEKKAAAAPAARKAAAVVAASAMTLSKTDMIGGLKAALLVVSDEQQKLGLQYALQLAQKLAD